MVGLIVTEASWPTIPTDRARHAAELINQLAPSIASEGLASNSERSSLTTAARV